MLSLPPFIIAVIVLYVLGVNLKLIPLGGAYALGVKPGLNLPFLLSVLQYAAGPVLAQALVQLSGWLLSARNVSVTILAEDFVKYGVARGLKRGTLTKKYIWKPARLPILTSLALSFGYMLGGSTLVESVFRYPGIGQQLGLALGSRDFGLAISIFTIMVIAVILASFLIELLYPLLDPRVRGA
jgi:peptide/nickel transport system permease protein